MFQIIFNFVGKMQNNAKFVGHKLISNYNLNLNINGSKHW